MNVAYAYNYKRVDAGLSTAGAVTEEQLHTLRAEGYEAVINLLPQSHPHAIANEREIVEEQGMLYIQIPVEFEKPTLANYNEFVLAMDTSAGQKTLIHCAKNYRASAFYAIYANQFCGWSRQEARDFIASVWRPSEHPPWDTFIESLLV